MAQGSQGDSGGSGTTEIRFGHEELVVRQRYEVLSIANDILIGLWFVAGSICFFSDSLATAGTWMFLIGSIELLIRPAIRLARRVHIQRFRPDRPASTSDDPGF